MTVESQIRDGRRTVILSGALNIWEAAETWRNLLPLLSSPEPLAMALAGVESCDAAGLQILCQIARAARMPGADIAMQDPSPAISAALAQAGMTLEPFANTSQKA